MPEKVAVPEKIVIATDGGPASRAAMNWVIHRALRVPVKVELVTVEELDWLPVGADESEYHRTYRDTLDAAETYLRNHHGIDFVSGTLLSGEPAVALAEAAEGADLLVIGSTRRMGTAGTLRGTLALRVAARATSRLVVVPADWEPSTGRIIVGFAEDGSSDAAVDAAVAEATRMGTALTVVHAWSLPAPFSVLDSILGKSYPTLEALHRRRLTDAVAKAKKAVPRKQVTSALRFGDPADVINELARDQSLVVVGQRHRTRIESLFLGSVGHDVLLAAPVPVLVVPSLS